MKSDAVFRLVELLDRTEVVTPDTVTAVLDQIDPELVEELSTTARKIVVALAVAFSQDIPAEIGIKIVRGVALGLAVGARLGEE